MRQIKVNDKEVFSLISAVESKETINGRYTKVVSLTIEDIDYATVKKLFSKDVKWAIIDNEKEYDHSEYNMLGSITDLMTGCCIIKLAHKLSEVEQLTNKLDESYEMISQIAGEHIEDIESAKLVRSNIESLYAQCKLSNEQRIIMITLSPKWISGNHKKGEIYSTNVNGLQIWECIQDYDNSRNPDIVPEDPSWGTFHKPFHGTTKETALEFMRPTGAHDTYDVGEYMIYKSKYYKCKRQTNFSPDENPSDWEEIK